VVFHGRGLRFLKPGFRHCFAAVDDGAAWLVADPRADRLVVRAHDRAFDLAAFYRGHGCTVVELVLPETAGRRIALRPLTCVEIVKHLLGLSAPGAFTPWRLYRRLTRNP
jgi:hypothetical protein